MTADVQPGWPQLQTTHPYPLRAVARPARGRPLPVATVLSVVETPDRLLAAGHYLSNVLERATGLTRRGPVVVRYTTEDDQALMLLTSNMVAGVVPDVDVETALGAYVEAGPPGVLLVACCFQLWPQTLATRRWS
ncbi:hypothetical protein [Blastococcus sp. CT_GayMR16]|uniref:hypothetical protein n=1 Tax=Blastococcus sp. CT_GayMR16 TaxID=2559607 RepID=UPI001073B286|nr:hypothetical protein [Blastococcus sp. CT_GayMR16]TFV83125.1 hypothetical protein E4P38_20945 [Blastococcus sp. CT_GayMR16]